MNKKQGNIFIPIGMLVLIIITFAMFLSYYQVNLIISNVKRDLYYIAREAILLFDVKELSYRNYLINGSNIKDKIEDGLTKEYTQSMYNIKEIQVMGVELAYNKEGVNVGVTIKVKFKSIINLMGDNMHEFNLREDVNISLMNY